MSARPGPCGGHSAMSVPTAISLTRIGQLDCSLIPCEQPCKTAPLEIGGNRIKLATCELYLRSSWSAWRRAR